MNGRSCAIVLIGTNTAGRKWITNEIKKAWVDGKGVLGVYVHNLLDSGQKQSSIGANPFASLTLGDKSLSSIVSAYDPPYSTSKNVYDYIKENLANWIEYAVHTRNQY
jgi:hypothetical protein